MKNLLSFGILVFGIALLFGCDQSAQNEAVIKDAEAKISDINEESKERRLQQLDEDGFLETDHEQISEVLKAIDEASEQVSDDQATALKEQAALIREFQNLIVVYDEILTELNESGSNDVTTITSDEDVQNRLDIADRLTAHNNKMINKMPRIFRRLGELENTQAMIEKQLSVQLKIRETDRMFFEHVREMLIIARPHWKDITVYEDGSFDFGYDISDEDLDRYNELVDLIDQIGIEQTRLQRELLELSP